MLHLITFFQTSIILGKLSTKIIFGNLKLRTPTFSAKLTCLLIFESWKLVDSFCCYLNVSISSSFLLTFLKTGLLGLRGLSTLTEKVKECSGSTEEQYLEIRVFVFDIIWQILSTFLAPKGAQEVQMLVCLLVSPHYALKVFWEPKSSW